MMDNLKDSKRGSVTLLVFAVLILIGSILLYFMFDKEIYQLIGIPLFSVAILMLIIDFVLWFKSPYRKIKEKFHKISSSLDNFPIDKMKPTYKEIYTLYMKLTEKQKQNFYARVNSLRESIEEKIKAAKNIELLLQDANVGDMEEKKERYEKIDGLLQKLAPEDQQRFSTKMAYYKEVLEGGAQKII